MIIEEIKTKHLHNYQTGKLQSIDIMKIPGLKILID